MTTPTPRQRRLIIATALAFLVTVLSSHLFAEPLTVSIPTEVSGLSGVNDITQTEDGTLYFTTRSGITTFDGASWTHHPLSSAVFGIVAHKGRIYAGGYGCIYEYLDGRLETRVLSNDSEAVRKLCTTSDNVLGARAQSLLSLKDGRAFTFPNWIMEVQTVGEHVYTLGGVLACIGEWKNSVLSDVTGTSLKDTGLTWADLAASDGRSLFLMAKTGLVVKMDEHGYSTLFTINTAELPTCMCSLPGGRLAFGGDFGVLIYDVKKGLEIQLSRGHGLPGTVVNQLFCDREGGLWVSTQHHVTRVLLDTEIDLRSEEAGLLGNVQCITPWKDDVLIGSTSGTFSLSGSGELRRLSANTTHALLAAGSAYFTVGSQLLYQGQAIIGRTLPGTPSASLHYTTGVMNNGALLCVGAAPGLSWYRWTSSGKWECQEALSHDTESSTGLSAGPGTWIWVSGHSRQVSRLRHEAGRWTEESCNQGLRENDVVQIWTTPDDVFAVNGSSAMRWEESSHCFKPSDAQLRTEGGFSVLEEAGRLWTPVRENSWETAPLPSKEIVNLVRQINSQENARVTALCYTSTRVFLASSAGLLVVPKAWKPRNSGLPVIPRIASVINLSNGAELGAARLAQLDRTERSLRIRIAYPHFDDMSVHRYRIFIEGMELPQWSSVAYRDFTNLAGGRYTMVIQALNGIDGQISEQRVALEVPHSPWTAPLAILFYIVGLTGISALFTSWRTRLFRRDNAALSALSTSLSEAKEELEKKHGLLGQELKRTERLAADLGDANRALHASMQEKVAFVRALSHELRNPIAGARMMSDLVLQRSAEGQERRQLENLSACVKYLQSLLDETLDLTQLEAGQISFKVESFTMGGLLRDLGSVFELVAQAKGVELVLVPGSEAERRYHGDRIHLERILMNFLSNAIKFTERGRIVLSGKNIGTEAGVCRLRFEVADTGAGVSKDLRPHLFRKFVRASSTGTRSSALEGAGLGLALCRQLADYCGGNVGHTENPLGGSTFHVELPFLEFMGETSSVEIENEGASAPDFSTLRVCVVDDDAMQREVFDAVLGAFGILPLCLSEAEAALELLSRETFDLVLIDQNLGANTGIELMHGLRSRGLATQGNWHLVSALWDASLAAKAQQAGFTSSHAKPLNTVTVFKILSEAKSRK